MKKLEYDEIKRFVQLVEQSEISELEIVGEGVTLRIRKDFSGNNQTQLPVSNRLAASPPSISAPVEITPGPEAAVEAKREYTEIRSPIVGTFYRSPSPEAESFVRTGDTVEQGRVLCIIEAMKLLNEIESDVNGRIVEICVENGKPVEFDQVLFLIEPV